MPKKTKKKITKRTIDKKFELVKILGPSFLMFLGVLVTSPYFLPVLMNQPQQNATIAKEGISWDDQVKLNTLGAEIEVDLGEYMNTTDSLKIRELDAKLTVLANEEAAIMKKYNPNYIPRWPHRYYEQDPIMGFVFLIWVGIIAFICYTSYLIIDFILEWKIRKYIENKYDIVEDSY